MYTDKWHIFSTSQALVTAQVTDSTKYIDTEAADPNLGTGQPVYLIVSVCVAPDSTGHDATLAAKLQDSADASTWVDTELSAVAVKVTTLSIGDYLINAVLPAKHSRYLKLVYTVGTSDLTAGAFDAYLALNPGP